MFPTGRLDHSQLLGDRTGQVRDTPKITRQIGLMKFGVNRTHINRQAHSRWDANAELGIGLARDRMWTERCEETRWGTPCKRALFGSDGPDTMPSGSDVTEAQLRWLQDGEYPMVAQSGWPYIDDFLEDAWSPRVELEDSSAATEGIRGSLVGNNTGRYLRPLCVQMDAMTSRRIFRYYLIWMEMLSM